MKHLKLFEQFRLQSIGYSSDKQNNESFSGDGIDNLDRFLLKLDVTTSYIW